MRFLQRTLEGLAAGPPNKKTTSSADSFSNGARVRPNPALTPNPPYKGATSAKTIVANNPLTIFNNL
ncbi:hypothetical protein ASB7_02200 [Helicobacter ailurogastricus]|nr:hypothetical protein ASB7_02200 [Helicobacter ailurogastricus]